MNEKLEHKRHTLAHLLAYAVLKDYPHAKPTIGPAIDDGFYYDFDFSGGNAPNDADLKKLEKTMKKTLSSWKHFSHREVTADEARDVFSGNEFKTELINDLEKEKATITLYTIGEGKTEFTDLCRGGHSASPSEDIDTSAFKLTSVAGAYWRGDEKNPMLTRIYGVAFDSKEDLDTHFKMLEEAKKRDHRKIGKEMDLFTFSDLVGPGLPLYTPKGQLLREIIKDLLWKLSEEKGYQKVEIPHITKIDLYETSGHADKFRDEFFYVRGAQSEDDFVMKPMNCPHHTQIYASRPRSYRDLPIRMAEVTHMYRDEKPGQLVGLNRVRSIAVDDAHIFCRPDQIKEEASNIADIIKGFYSKFDLWEKGKTFWVSLSVRDSKTPEKYLGSDENWNRAEHYLQQVSDELGLDAKRMEGEAAFYGPKLDFMFTDALGRERQLATIQIDFVMPERFELEYTDSDGSKQRPVMIHRAVAGSLERFMAAIIEHYAGKFPLWLAPDQIRIIPVADTHNAYAEEIYTKLKAIGIRVSTDTGKDSMGKKIRNAKTDRLPYFAVVGDEEIKNDTVTLEFRNGTSEVMGVEELGNHLLAEIDTKK